MTLFMTYHTIKYSNHIILWYVLIFLLISNITIPVIAQKISIHDISTINQLPVNAIHRIFQDHEGYICMELLTVFVGMTGIMFAYSVQTCILQVLLMTI